MAKTGIEYGDIPGGVTALEFIEGPVTLGEPNQWAEVTEDEAPDVMDRASATLRLGPENDGQAVGVASEPDSSMAKVTATCA